MSDALSAVFAELTKLQRNPPRRVTRHAERCQLQALLRRHGGRRLSSGKFASAYLIDGQVLKLVSRRDSQGYLMYAQIARRQSARCPILPRVERVMSVGRYSIVHMERLYRNKRLAERAAGALADFMEGEGAIEPAAHACRRRKKGVACVQKAIGVLQRRRPRSLLDIHGGNIMFRREGGTLRAVLTDPVTW